MPNPGGNPETFFKAGNPGGPGRKPGAAQKYRMLDYWGARLEKDIDNLDADERVKSYLKMIELILSYKALSPNTTPSLIAEMEAIYEARRQKMRKPEVQIDSPRASGEERV